MQETCGYFQQRWPYMKTIVYWKDDIDIQKIHLCENLVGLFIKSLLRRTFEQLVPKIVLCHLNDVSLHEERNRRCKEHYYIEWCTFFPSLGFIPKGFSSKVFTSHILNQWTPKGEYYELMVVHWFDTITHMIDTHMIHYSLCKYL